MRKLSLIGRIDLALIRFGMFLLLIAIEHDLAAWLFGAHTWILPYSAQGHDLTIRWILGVYLTVIASAVYRQAMRYLEAFSKFENRVIHYFTSRYAIVRKK